MSVLIFCLLPHARADVTLSCSSSPYCVFSYDSETGATATVRVKGDYTLASPAQLTNATQTPPLGQLFFNLTGKTTGLSSSQFQFEVWNTSNTGILPLVLQSGTVYPSYALNLLNYTYSSTTLNITAYTQLSNQTVTVNFGAALSNFRIYQSTGTISSAPTLASDVLTLVVSDSGAGASTITRIYGASGASANPVSWTLNGGAPAVTPTYDSASNTLTLTGVGTWSLNYHQVNPVGPPGVTTTQTSSLYTYTFPLVGLSASPWSGAVNQGQTVYGSTTLRAIATSGVVSIDDVQFDMPWITLNQTEKNIGCNCYLLFTSTVSPQLWFKVAPSANLTAGTYIAHIGIGGHIGDMQIGATTSLTILIPGTTVPNAFVPPSLWNWQAPASLSELLGEHPVEKIVLLIAAIMFLAVVIITSRRRH